MEVSRTAFKSDMNIFGCSGQRVMSERVVSGQGGLAKDGFFHNTAAQPLLDARCPVMGFGADRQMHDTHMTRGAVAL
ncbi:hypothetical protein SAMN04488117_11640 [Celeribacter baekdonensis]|nr:hypothetical protein SAMN04488117_11640 [Celeribacter baekdonensis]